MTPWLTRALLAPMILAALGFSTASAESRRIVALYSGERSETPRQTEIHDIAQLPLNHLGLTVSYYDVTEGLPPPEVAKSARGILTWFSGDTDIPNGPAYAEWLSHAADAGTKLVIFGHPGFDPLDIETAAYRGILRRFGISWTGQYVKITFDTAIQQRDPAMMDFERALPPVLVPFHVVRPAAPEAKSHLVLKAGNGQHAHTVMTTPGGGYAAAGYQLHQEAAEGDTLIRQWLLDPFAFFAKAYDTHDLPAPDVTTRAGRRIYYSHIDGDGWMNPTLIEAYQNRNRPFFSSEVVRREAIAAFPELPVTVAPVGANLDPAWHGTKRSRRIARDIFAETQVEAGNHTLSHPFEWRFFAQPDHREREAAFFAQYPGAERLISTLGRMRAILGLAEPQTAFDSNEAYSDYARPRAFGLEPFSLETEIEGARHIIAALLPPDKHVNTYQWSGDTEPFAEALTAVSDSPMVNINGGDSRLDPEFPSYAWTAPFGIEVGNSWQVFASNSNENTYTENWTGRYFGFKYLKKTLENTEQPIRVAPFNVYYHMFSGERRSSLDALISNLKYAQARPLIPLPASTYARIAQGFRKARLTKLGPQRWRITDRGKLNTLRFDQALFQAVDFTRSQGVIGQRRLHGSLYVALDPSAASPVIALRGEATPTAAPQADRPYLIESAWDVQNLDVTGQGFQCQTAGFADGAMRWRVAPETAYRVTVSNETGRLARLTRKSDAQGILTLTLAPHVPGGWPKGPVTLVVEAAKQK